MNEVLPTIFMAAMRGGRVWEIDLNHLLEQRTVVAVVAPTLKNASRTIERVVEVMGFFLTFCEFHLASTLVR